ncbi:MAG: proteasome assembly chaperone family protein [Candidatus Odinarchaeota archaeon]|nr:proteasome assembly chaperone family protein [Candidatus Odinarchaeota archaeon]
MEGRDVKIVEEGVLERPIVVVGLPDVGLVGFISAMHLIKQLNMEQVGWVESDLLPPIVFVHKGNINEAIRLYQGENIVLVTSEIPIPEVLISPLSRSLVEWAIKKGAKFLITLGGVPVPNRLEIEKPEHFIIATDEQSREVADRLNFEMLQEGAIVGVYASILSRSKKSKLPAIAILAQCFSNYPDPGAAASTIEALSKIVGREISVEELIKKSEDLRVQLRELMLKTSRSLRQIGKSQELEIPPMYT